MNSIDSIEIKSVSKRISRAHPNIRLSVTHTTCRPPERSMPADWLFLSLPHEFVRRPASALRVSRYLRRRRRPKVG